MDRYCPRCQYNTIHERRLVLLKETWWQSKRNRYLYVDREGERDLPILILFCYHYKHIIKENNSAKDSVRVQSYLSTLKSKDKI